MAKPLAFSLVVLALVMNFALGSPDALLPTARPNPCQIPPASAPTGYIGVCSAGVTSCTVQCASSASPPWFQEGRNSPTATCRDGRWSYTGCAQGCPAAAAPAGYIGDCPAGLSCTNVSCDAGYGYVPVPTPSTPPCPKGLGLHPEEKRQHRRGSPGMVVCNATTHTWAYIGCMLPCLATTAPHGYIGDCPAGVICNSTTSTPPLACDQSAGYFLIPPKPQPQPHSLPLRGMASQKPSPPAPAPTATCPLPGGVSFQYAGCAPGCAAATAPVGYIGDCAMGLTCANVSCDVGLGYYPLPSPVPWHGSHLGFHEEDKIPKNDHKHHKRGSPAPWVTCNATTLTFQYTGCSLGCDASVAPVGYVGNCAAGVTCNTTVTCDASAGYFPIPDNQNRHSLDLGVLERDDDGGRGKRGPKATCNTTSFSFQYTGCGLGCQATTPPTGYTTRSGVCAAGFTCEVSCTNGRRRNAQASCAGNLALFTFSGCN